MLPQVPDKTKEEALNQARSLQEAFLPNLSRFVARNAGGCAGKPASRPYNSIDDLVQHPLPPKHWSKYARKKNGYHSANHEMLFSLVSNWIVDSFLAKPARRQIGEAAATESH